MDWLNRRIESLLDNAIFGAICALAFVMWSVVSKLPPPLIVTIGLAVFTLTLFILKIIRNMLKKQTSLDKSRYKEYDASHSQAFYNATAAFYDQRNSPELLETHREVIKFISNHLGEKTAFKVLDLGGGTGKLIALHFFDSEEITWSYLDYSPAMVEQFSQNLRNTKLHLDIKVKDILSISGLYPTKTFDVILLSLVLTSMPRMPNFEEILTFLKDDGIFIIADIDPDYTTLYPFYIVLVGKRPLAFIPNRINVSELNKTMISFGLKQLAIKTIKDGDTNYSFVYVFTR